MLRQMTLECHTQDYRVSSWNLAARLAGWSELPWAKCRSQHNREWIHKGAVFPTAGKAWHRGAGDWVAKEEQDDEGWYDITNNVIFLS